MNYALRLFAFTLLATVSLSAYASADYWARIDRPWRAEELDQAIAFCRLKPQVSSDVKLFVDVLMGRQIDKCMHDLGWIGVAK
jgi:hypothetical protein